MNENDVSEDAFEAVEAESGNCSVIMYSQQFDDEELNAMRGDNIGETAYSAKWTINTLISLSKVQDTGWNEGLENELCTLWDMTAENDTVTFLLENNFLRLAQISLEMSQEPRLTEIILGIIGNMCCHMPVLESIGNNKQLIVTILNLLLCDDTESLLQILRLLQAAVWDIQRNLESPWISNLKDCNFLGDSLTFILNSSTNTDLLSAALDLLLSLSLVDMSDDENFLLMLFNIEKLVPALFEFFDQVISEQNEMFTEKEIRIIEKWLNLLSTVFKLTEIFKNNENSEIIARLMAAILKILKPYEHLHILIPLEERTALCIQECAEISLRLQQAGIDVTPEINSIIATIIYNLNSVEKENVRDQLYAMTQELKDYLERYWIEILECCTVEHAKATLSMCSANIVDNFVDIISQRSNVSQNKLKKLLDARSLL